MTGGPLPIRRSNSCTPRTCRSWLSMACSTTSSRATRGTCSEDEVSSHANESHDQSQKDRQRVGDLFDRCLLLRREGRGHVAVDVDLAQDQLSPADENHQLRTSPGVAGQVILDRPDVGHILVFPGGDGRAADADADRYAGVVGLPSREGLEHQLVFVEHVQIDRRVGRTRSPDFFGGDPEQLLSPCLPRKRSPEGGYYPGALEDWHPSLPACPAGREELSTLRLAERRSLPRRPVDDS